LFQNFWQTINDYKFIYHLCPREKLLALGEAQIPLCASRESTVLWTDAFPPDPLFEAIVREAGAPGQFMKVLEYAGVRQGFRSPQPEQTLSAMSIRRKARP
jgi:hypothetical protein